MEKKINRLEAMLHVLGRRVEDQIDSGQGLKPSGLNLQPPNVLLRSPLPVSLNPGSLPTPSLETLLPDDLACSQHPGSYSEGAEPGWTSVDPSLPPFGLLLSLVDLYFKHVNTWCPILDRITTFKILQDPFIQEEADCVLFHAIVTISLRFSKDPSLTPESRKHYHNASKQRVQLYGLEHSNVRALQVLTILALDTLGTSDDPQTWYISLLAQKVTQLGLDLERKFILSLPKNNSTSTIQGIQLSQPKSWTEDEERRRLFWMVYVLDRYFTADTTLKFALDDNKIDRQLPCRYDLFSRNQPVKTRRFVSAETSETTIDTPENLGSFSYHCELLRILSRIRTFLTKPLDINSPTEVEQWQDQFRGLDVELDAWLFSLPDEHGKISQFCHSDPNSKISNWIVIHAAYITTVIRLHSAAAYPSVHSHIFKPSYNAMQKCLSAIVSLQEISLDANNSMLDLLGPTFAYSLWVAARLLLVNASITEHELDPNVGLFICTLHRMGQYWDIAQHYAEVLSRLLQENHLNNHIGGEAEIGAFSRSRTFASMRRYSKRLFPLPFPAHKKEELTNTSVNSEAFEMNLLISQKRTSVRDPISVRTVTSNELEKLAIFDFFNCPRLRTKVGSSPDMTQLMDIVENIVLVDGVPLASYARPDPEADWFSTGNTMSLGP